MVATLSRPLEPAYVPETRFGRWFLGTDTWFNFVLKAAILDLYAMTEQRLQRHPVIVDVGCGQGRSFRLLKIMFRATRLVGIEWDDENLAQAKRRADADRVDVDLLKGDCSSVDLPDGAADMVFCHQTFHHLVHQERSLSEFRRILKPGGLLLFSESTKAYIHSWIIRLLFAHPMDVQRTADEYVAMIEGHAFEIAKVAYPYSWWSRPDFGVLERLGWRPKKHGERMETLVNVVARKPTVTT